VFYTEACPKSSAAFFSSTTLFWSVLAAACGERMERTIEIGPGRGTLTRHLLPRTAELHAIELDRA